MIELRNINKVYGEKDSACHALKDVNLKIETGEFVAIVGKSGSGKTTLFNIIGGIDSNYSGECYVDLQNLKTMSVDRRARLRRSKIGIVYQFFNLVSYLTVKENMILSAKLNHKQISESYLDEILRKLDLFEKKNSYVDELSGGQKQRVALGRVILADCQIILADEPTGNLDQKSAQLVIDLIRSMHDMRKTVVLITHDMDIANLAQRKIELMDGRII